MKDQEAIKKLQLLKSIQPPNYTLKRIKNNVFLHIQSENNTRAYRDIQEQISPLASLLTSFSITFYAGTIAFLLIIILSASVLIFPNQLHTALLYGRLAAASNQYKKARIALDDTKSRFTNNKVTQINANELAYSLAQTNTQLNELKLKGEKGKYTAEECRQIYHEYLVYLESREKGIPEVNTNLKSQINSYEEQAEKKLHMYKSL